MTNISVSDSGIGRDQISALAPIPTPFYDLYTAYGTNQFFGLASYYTIGNLIYGYPSTYDPQRSVALPAYDVVVRSYGQNSYGKPSSYDPIFDATITDFDMLKAYDQTVIYGNTGYSQVSDSSTVVIQVSFPLADRAIGAEGLVIANSNGNKGILLADIGKAIDFISKIVPNIYLKESGRGTDVVLLSSPPTTITVVLNEKGNSTQTLAIKNILGALLEILGYDTAQPRITYDFPSLYDAILNGRDTIALTAKLTLNELDRALYGFLPPQGYDISPSSYDTSILQDAVALSVSTILQELGHGIDAIALTINVSLLEATKALYGILPPQSYDIPPMFYDTSLLQDVVFLSSMLSPSDVGHGTDTIVLTIKPALFELAVGIDASITYSLKPYNYDISSKYDFILNSPQITNMFSLPEVGHGTDIAPITVTFSANDTGHGVDSILRSIKNVLQELGTGSDTIALVGALVTQARLLNKNITIYLYPKTPILTVKTVQD